MASIAACCGVSVAVAAYYLLNRPKKATATIPTTMRRLVVTRTADELENVTIQVQETPVPTLGFGKVLIKMEAVPLVRCVMPSLGRAPNGDETRFSLQPLLFACSFLFLVAT